MYTFTSNINVNIRLDRPSSSLRNFSISIPIPERVSTRIQTNSSSFKILLGKVYELATYETQY